MFVEQKQSVFVFFSYEKRDKRLRDRLEDHLSDLRYRGLITTWHDRKILAGEDWLQQIDASLEKAQIILLLISAHFMASDYCYGREMQQALRLHAQQKAAVIPILLRPVVVNSAPFKNLSMLPTNGKPVTLWRDRDSAFVDVVLGIEKIAERYAWGAASVYDVPENPVGSPTSPTNTPPPGVFPSSNLPPGREKGHNRTVLPNAMGPGHVPPNMARRRPGLPALLAAIVLVASIVGGVVYSRRLAVSPLSPTPVPTTATATAAAQVTVTASANATATAAVKSGATPFPAGFPLALLGIFALALCLLLLLSILLLLHRRRSRLRREAEKRAALEEARRRAETRLQTEEQLQQQAEVRRQLAQQRRKRVYYLKNIQVYRRAVSNNPQDDQAWRGLGNSHFALAEYADAMDAFQHAFQSQPTASAYAGAGNACARLGRHAEAITFYERALQLESDVTLNYPDFIHALQAVGKVSEAAQMQAWASQLGYLDDEIE